MKDVVYICGPITGVADYRSRFALLESELSVLGYTVLSPAKLPAGLEYDQYMAIDRVLISQCECVVLMDGWENSNGSKEEVEYARKIGIGVKVIGEGGLVDYE